MEKPDNCILVIFGASGDLTKRKLIPSLLDLYCQKLLPDRFAVLGVSRSDFSDRAFREQMIESLREFGGEHAGNEELLLSFSEILYYQPIDTESRAEYEKMSSRLSSLNTSHGTDGNYIYYLATPPDMYGVIPEHLGAHGLHEQVGIDSTRGRGKGWKRLIVEKPFGFDLESAMALNRKILSIFEEDQVYRIDHYLGKETLQNLLAFRFSNGFFEPLWNHNYIDYVEITAAESLGVGSRGRYYDTSGALRDMLQNHLFHVAGVTAMEPPSIFSADTVRNETVKVFQSFRPMSQGDVGKHVIRGQYTAAKVHGEEVPGYREEPGIPPDSRTETYIAMKLFIDNWRWSGVPFFIRTGKRMPTRVTEVVIHLKRTPHHLFSGQDSCGAGCNKLIIRIQPDEGISLKFGLKMPGAGFQIRDVSMDFHYSELTDTCIPSAYERLLLDCMLGDATLYARADAVEACWKFVTPVIDAWSIEGSQKLYGYPAGTWGPKEAATLFDRPGLDWRYPCRNLAENGNFCEL